MLPMLALTVALTAPGPVPAATGTLDDTALAAVIAAVRARMGESADVSVDAVSRVDALRRTPHDAVLDPTAGIGASSRVVFRALADDTARLVPIGAATIVLRVAVEHAHAARALRRGATIEDGDVVAVTHDLPRGPLRALPLRDDVVGARATRDLPAGACIAAAAVAAQPVVRPGAVVAGVLVTGGIEVRATALVALDAGRVGGRIRVMNPDSRRTFRARIVSRDLVEIQP